MERRSGRKVKKARTDSTQSEVGNQPKRNHYTTVKMAPCKICGRKSSGYHFGVVTCEACKAFFRRAISKNSKISDTCRQGNFLCAENPTKITGCPACRMSRCKELGMSKGGARKGRYSLELRTQSILDARLEQEKIDAANHHTNRATQNDYVDANEHLQQHQERPSHDSLYQPQYLEQHGRPVIFIRDLEGSYSDDVSDKYIPNGDPYFYNDENNMAPTMNCMTSEQNFMTSPHEHMTSTQEDVTSTDDLEISLSDLRQNWMNKEISEFMNEIGDFDLEPDNPSCKKHESYNPSDLFINDSSPISISPHGLTYPSTPKPLPLIPENETANFDSLIKELVSLQDRLFPHKHQDGDVLLRQKQIEEEHIQREEAYKFMFGENTAEYVSPREFNEVFTEVNIELDDRLKVLREKARDNEKNIVQYIQHSRYIPGFHTLDLDDMLKLLKESYFEFWLFSNHVYFNDQKQVSGGSDAVCNGHKKMIYSLFPRHYVDSVFTYTNTLKELRLSLEEVSVIRVIILTFTDRCQLKYPSRVETLQALFTKCLIYQLSKTEDEYLPRFCRIIDRLIEIRTLTNLNCSVNRQFIKDWSGMLKDFPLWREMISHHKDTCLCR